MSQREPGSLGALIERNARDLGGGEALVFEDRRLTYAAFADRARRLASGLHDLGIGRQDRVAFLAMNCLAPYEIFGACELAGFIPAAVNFRLASPEMLHILTDSAPRVLIFQAQYANIVDGLRATLSREMRYVCIGDSPDWALGYEELIASGAPDGPPIIARPDDIAHIFYTSGTTGRPKGVIHTHEVVCRWLGATALLSEFTGGTRVLQSTPAFHVGGKLYVGAAAWVGGTTVVTSGFEAVRFADLIERERISFTFMVAPMIEGLLDLPDLARRDFSHLRKVVSAAAPIPVPLLRRAVERLGPVFAVQYGSTETGNLGNLWRHEVRPDGTDDDVRLLASVGRPAAGVEMRILDDAGRDMPVGEPGEVVIRSPTLMAGYWNNHAATAEAVRDGWYHTGDIGLRDARGYLFLVDRKKDMIISGGENIYSREVEDALSLHPAIGSVSVIGVPDERWGEVVCAIVVAREPVDTADLLAHARGRIAPYKVPKHIRFVEELPYLPSGKINKVELRRAFSAAHPMQTSQPA